MPWRGRSEDGCDEIDMEMAVQPISQLGIKTEEGGAWCADGADKVSTAMRGTRFSELARWVWGSVDEREVL